MCNLYANTTSQEAMRQLFQVRPELDGLGNAAPQNQIKPDNQVPIVRIDREGNRAMTLARWGYRKVKFAGKNYETWLTNTRNLNADAWRHVLEERGQRCLVPASSFAEYHPTEKFMASPTNVRRGSASPAMKTGRRLPLPDSCGVGTGKKTGFGERRMRISPLKMPKSSP